MKVLSIFAEGSSLLYTVQYDTDDRDSLSTTYDELTDTEHLRSFFKQFKKDFESFYGKLTVAYAVNNTINDADHLFALLLEFAEGGDSHSLNDLFKPLDNSEAGKAAYELQQLKCTEIAHLGLECM